MEKWPRPLVIGHRGACAHAPENTMASFKLAIEQHADAIEFDVKLSSDNQVMVIHDTSVNRTTNGNGKVANMSLTSLQELDAGGKFAERFTGEKIPSLQDVFDRFGNQILMNVELTNYSTPFDGLVKKVVELVRYFKLENRVIFSSFLINNLKVSQRLLPEVPCGLLAYQGWMGYYSRHFGWKKRFQALHPFLVDVDQVLVDNVHAAGKRIHVWTVNGEENLNRLLDLKVDGIFTDDPGLLRQIMDKRK